MPVCSQCDSYSRAGSAYCSQCGGKLLGSPERLQLPAPPRRAIRRAALVGVAGALLLVLAVVVLVVLEPDAIAPPGGARPARGGTTPGSMDDVPVAESDVPIDHDVPAATSLGDAGRLRPLTGREASQRLTPALVVLELLDRDGKRWSETRGVIVGADGVVLCRYRPLLGAYRGVARLPDRTADRADILGVSAYLPAEDLALVRVRTGQREFEAAPMVESRIDELYERGDEIYVFSNYRALVGMISDARYSASDGMLRARLEADEAIPPEVFLAIDPFGAVLGLCRVEVGGELLDTTARLPRSSYRVLIDSTASLAGAVDGEAFSSLAELTAATYEGTFAAHVRRGEEAHSESRWADAIEAFTKALDQIPYEIPPANEVERISGLLADDYDRHIRALLAEDRSREALVFAELAVERLPQEALLWILRGACGLKTGEPPLESVQALLQAKALGAPAAQWRDLLEDGYLLLAQSELAVGDVRGEESSLLDGLSHLPDSAALSLALARLYYRIEAFDDVPQLLAQVDRLDPRMRNATEELRRQIDEVVKNRDSVVIPISREDRSYRTDVVVDGQFRFDFIIDTGASFTAIPHEMALELGYDLAGAERIGLSTASGTITAPRIQLGSLDVRGYTVRNLRVVVLPQGVGPREGLLGLNFLSHFKYTVDAGRNEFRLQRP